MFSNTFLFTSESVGEGHPDKMCDQISDAILDACVKVDPLSKVACEAAAKTGMILLFGEISTKAELDYQEIVRDTIKRIGYDDSKKGFDYKTCSVLVAIDKQSQEIAEGLHYEKKLEELGSGDQGLMFGYATNETQECLPMSLLLAHKLNMELAKCRKDGSMPFLLPDCKSQVTVEYEIEDGAYIPLRVDTIVISTQHVEEIRTEDLRAILKEKIVKRVIPEKFLDSKTIYHLNPSGRFTKGGPHADAGLTGRKIIVDTYGGHAPHGGGAFSGKDFSKVDRSGAYAARWIAKSLVKAGLAKRVTIQTSYAIGVAEPISLYLDSHGTGFLPDPQLLDIVKKNFDLRPGVIAKQLGLDLPIYFQTAVHGHFTNPDFPWEKPKKLSY